MCIQAYIYIYIYMRLKKWHSKCNRLYMCDITDLFERHVPRGSCHTYEEVM